MLSRVLHPSRRAFASLNEREIVSLAVAAEEEDGRIYAAYAEKLRAHYPSTAKVFEGMAEEEDGHRRRLLAVIGKFQFIERHLIQRRAFLPPV